MKDIYIFVFFTFLSLVPLISSIGSPPFLNRFLPSTAVIDAPTTAVIDDTIDTTNDPIVFLNPANNSILNVPIGASFVFLRNHSFSSGGGTGIFPLVTAIGKTKCTDYKDQMSSNFTYIVCNDTSGISYMGFADTNLDPNVLQAQFRYEFNTDPRAKTNLSIDIVLQAFPVWRGPGPDSESVVFTISLVPIGRMNNNNDDNNNNNHNNIRPKKMIGTIEDVPFVDETFINPIGSITVSPGSRIAILRNHSFSIGSGTGYQPLLTMIGNTACTDYQSQVMNEDFSKIICSDGNITTTNNNNLDTDAEEEGGLVNYYGFLDTNQDPIVLQGQFRYEFSFSNAFKGPITIVIKTFQVWKGQDKAIDHYQLIIRAEEKENNGNNNSNGDIMAVQRNNDNNNNNHHHLRHIRLQKTSKIGSIKKFE